MRASIKILVVISPIFYFGVIESLLKHKPEIWFHLPVKHSWLEGEDSEKHSVWIQKRNKSFSQSISNPSRLNSNYHVWYGDGCCYGVLVSRYDFESVVNFYSNFTWTSLFRPSRETAELECLWANMKFYGFRLMHSYSPLWIEAFMLWWMQFVNRIIEIIPLNFTS